MSTHHWFETHMLVFNLFIKISYFETSTVQYIYKTRLFLKYGDVYWQYDHSYITILRNVKTTLSLFLLYVDFVLLMDLYSVHEAITNVFYIYTHKFERIIIQATSPNQLEFCRQVYKKCPIPEFDNFSYAICKRQCREMKTML